MVQNPGKMLNIATSGAESGAFDRKNLINWSIIREMIEDCDDLPHKTKLRILAIGDEATQN